MLVEDGGVAVSSGETCDRTTGERLGACFRQGSEAEFTFDTVAETVAEALPPALLRTTPFLTHPVFHQHRSETEMLRYLRRLADKDIALDRSEEHTSELQSLMRISYAVFCLKKKKQTPIILTISSHARMSRH